MASAAGAPAVLVGVGVGAAVGYLLGGGNEVKQTATFMQDINNSVYQNITAVCEANCDVRREGDVVTIIDSNVGDISFDQICKPKASCAIDQTTESIVENSLQTIAEQSSFIQNSFLGLGGSKSESNIDIQQRINNQVSQIISSSCKVSAKIYSSGNVFYAKNSDTGNISFAQNGTPEATCAMNNAAKITLYNEAVGKTEQNSSIISFTGGLLLVIGIIVIIAILGFVIITVIKGSSSKTS